MKEVWTSGKGVIFRLRRDGWRFGSVADTYIVFFFFHFLSYQESKHFPGLREPIARKAQNHFV